MGKHHLPEASVYPSAVPALTCCTELLREAEALSTAPNFWLPLVKCQGELGGREAPLTAAEQAVQHLYQTIICHRLEAAGCTVAGAEWWCQVYKAGRGLTFHFDKDEHLMREQGRMVNPLLSSILYLTGDPEQDTLPQAPTVILDQVFDQEQGRPVPPTPTTAVLVWPQAGSYAVFDGRLGHGVLDCCGEGVRVTLLINWWTKQPQDVHEVTQADIARYSLAVHRPLPLPQCMTPCHASRGVIPQASRQPEGTSAGLLHENSPVQQDSLYINHSTAYNQHRTGMRMSSPQAADIPVVEVSGNDVYLVDDLLADNKLSLRGPEAVHAVAFVHPGLMLHPLDWEEQVAANGPGMQPYDTLAVFVPLGDVSSDDSSDTDSSDDGSQQDSRDPVAQDCA